VVLGEGAVSYERGTPVGCRTDAAKDKIARNVQCERDRVVYEFRTRSASVGFRVWGLECGVRGLRFKI